MDTSNATLTDRLNVPISPELKADLERLAKQEQRSTAAMVRILLARAIKMELR